MAILKNRGRDDRPWGFFERFTLNEPTTVKLIVLNPGAELSLQTHENRSEFWRVLSGSGEVTIGQETRPAKQGDEFEISPGLPHRANGGENGITLLEIAVGTFSEEDERRLDDRYGRSD